MGEAFERSWALGSQSLHHRPDHLCQDYYGFWDLCALIYSEARCSSSLVFPVSFTDSSCLDFDSSESRAWDKGSGSDPWKQEWRTGWVGQGRGKAGVQVIYGALSLRTVKRARWPPGTVDWKKWGGMSHQHVSPLPHTGLGGWLRAC